MRIGQRDYLVRIQNKSENKIWTDIAPVILDTKLPKFNVGIVINQDLEQDSDYDDMRDDMIRDLQTVDDENFHQKQVEKTHEAIALNNRFSLINNVENQVQDMTVNDYSF